VASGNIATDMPSFTRATTCRNVVAARRVLPRSMGKCPIILMYQPMNGIQNNSRFAIVRNG
jgi:hypothetical protein